MATTRKLVDKSRTEPLQLKQKDLSDVRQELLVRQRYRCALCTVDLRELPAGQRCVDHDHSKSGPRAGAIRGVLCSNCNSMEGKIYNRAIRAKRKLSYIEWLANLLKYWKKHSTNQTGLYHPLHLLITKSRRKRKTK